MYKGTLEKPGYKKHKLNDSVLFHVWIIRRVGVLQICKKFLNCEI